MDEPKKNSDVWDLSWIRSRGVPLGPLSLSMAGRGVRTSLLGPTSEGIVPTVEAVYQRTVTLSAKPTGTDTENEQGTYEIPR